MNKEIIQKVGRKKTAVARVVLKEGKGDIFINNEKVEDYINNEMLLMKLKEPLILSDTEGKFDIKVNVFGGGVVAQTFAIRQGIARAIVEFLNDENIKKIFLDYDRSLLITDVRFKEPKKPNNSHARAKRQKSYR